MEEILAHVSNNFTIDQALTVVEKIINFSETTLSSNPLAGAIFESNPIFYKLNHEGNTIFIAKILKIEIFISFMFNLEIGLKTRPPQ